MVTPRLESARGRSKFDYIAHVTPLHHSPSSELVKVQKVRRLGQWTCRPERVTRSGEGGGGVTGTGGGVTETVGGGLHAGMTGGSKRAGFRRSKETVSCRPLVVIV